MIEHDKLAEKLKNVEVLIIDADDQVRNLIQDVFKKLGFRKIFLAKDGFDGIQTLKNENIDLIITDWELKPKSGGYIQIPKNAVITTEYGDFPPINGASFVKSLRHSKGNPHPFVPVIMITVPTLQNHVMYARDAGVNEILLKPIDVERLCERIIRIVEQPKIFVTSKGYKGPCRRNTKNPVPPEGKERRIKEIRVVRYEEKAA